MLHEFQITIFSIKSKNKKTYALFIFNKIETEHLFFFFRVSSVSPVKLLLLYLLNNNNRKFWIVFWNQEDERENWKMLRETGKYDNERSREKQVRKKKNICIFFHSIWEKKNEKKKKIHVFVVKLKECFIFLFISF